MSPSLRQLRDHTARAGRVAGALALQRIQRPERRHVLFNSFGGAFSDSPRAIFEELNRRNGDRRSVWVGEGAGGPAGSPSVALYSWPYLRAVGRTGSIVSNVQMPKNFHKRPGVTYLQTWHGTPLKRIGFDNQRWAMNPSGFQPLVRDIAKWDLLVSPNAFSTEIFRRAFRFDGEILETGYPRNDVLSAPDRDAVRARVRRRLGLDEGVTAVLYAPTWRDNLVDADGRPTFSLALDVEAVNRRLGGDHVLLLRLHYLLADRVRRASSRAVRDVSAHPDIRELYLAADVMITDYSSTMFDFAVTGKPMIFFAYDLERYRDDVRGFYFDLEAEAPGPVCRTTDEVISALADLDHVHAGQRDRYARFRARFCHHDDGAAAARVVDRVFGPAG